MRVLMTAAFAAAAAFAGPAMAQEKLSITPELIEAAEKEGQLTLQYSAPLNAMQALVESFNEAYPKIRVNLERKAGSSGVQAMLQENAAGVHRIDVFQGTDTHANAELIVQNMLTPVVPETVDLLPESALAQAPHIYYPDVIRTVVMYNPQFVSEEEAEMLRDWRGILDPAFKGRLSLVEPRFGVTLAPLLYIMNNEDLGEEFLSELKAQDPAVFLNTAQARDAVISGHKPISWGAQWESVSFSTYEQGAPIRFLYPTPSVSYGGNGWALLEKAPHPNAARLFFAWGMSREGGLAIQGEAYNGRSALADLDDTRVVVQRLSQEPWFQPVGETWSPDIQNWIDKGSEYQETWTRIIKAN